MSNPPPTPPLFTLLARIADTPATGETLTAIAAAHNATASALGLPLIRATELSLIARLAGLPVKQGRPRKGLATPPAPVTRRTTLPRRKSRP